ncbi:MAG: hypothetical protein FJX80_08900 [Bacteroidetes bacterium]|nr:hypothetical protein [Bacteroidota bacterium]
MRSFLLIVYLFMVGLLNAQSKKEQIEILTNRVDSLNRVVGEERISNQNKINELNSTVTKLEGQIAALSGNLTTLNKELQDSKDVILKKQKEIVENQRLISKLQSELKIKSDSLEILSKPKNYLDKLPKGFSMAGPNGEEGERCFSDLDGDGKKDLVILLYPEEESGGLITIFLSTNFYSRNEFQYFEWTWISNTMGGINCNNGIIEISGGQTANDISVNDEVSLIYNTQQQKMVINSAVNEIYELDKLIDSENKDLVLKTGVID